jgi:hypothetical protein
MLSNVLLKMKPPRRSRIDDGAPMNKEILVLGVVPKSFGFI